jgi:glycosyltransferase involved in cell wall biosynthesis
MSVHHSTSSFVILQILPSLNSGGVERGTLEIAKAIQEKGWKAVVASRGGRMVEELESYGAIHIPLPLHSKNPFIIMKNIKKIEDLIKQYQVQLIHVRSRAPAWSAYFAAKNLSIPFVTTFHGTYNQGWFGLKKIYNHIMTRGHKVIAISDFIARHITQDYACDPQKVVVIQRGVDLEKFNPQLIDQERCDSLRTEWAIPPHKKIILLPGRLTRWKGHQIVIDALVLMKHQDIICLFVGDDQGRVTYRQELEKSIIDHALEDCVKIVGNHSDMPVIYALADIVVSASTDPEAFGRVIVEAQAMGKPVIVTKNGAGPDLIIEGVTGTSIEPSNPHQLAQTLSQWLSRTSDQIEHSAQIAQDFVSEHFTTRLLCSKTLDLYQSLLSHYP